MIDMNIRRKLIVVFISIGLLFGVRFFSEKTSSASRFTSLEFPDGFILDHKTKLVWQRCPLGTQLGRDKDGPLCQGDADWLNVKFSRATAERFAQYGDAWRLPTVDELRSISTTNKRCYSLDPIAFPIFEEPAERPVLTSLLDRYSFHSSNVDERSKLSWRVDSASGKSLQEPLRTPAYTRLVRNVTQEELSNSGTNTRLDRSDLSRVEKRLGPPPVPRSTAYLEAHEQAVLSGKITGEDCQSLFSNESEKLRGCLSGIHTNINNKLREGAEYAAANKLRKSYECGFDDPVINIGCRDYFKQYLGDVWPSLPEETTTADCKLEVEAEFLANIRYDNATGWGRGSGRRIQSMAGEIQLCSAYDEAHAKGLKVVDRPGFKGGPSPY